jgi:hypothetical protein
MRLATSQHLVWRQGLAAPHSLKIMRERGVRPAVGFSDPWDVLKDPHLTIRDKREILSSWASDASAVQDEPSLRWLLGTPEPVPLAEVREALERLDRRTDAGVPPPPPHAAAHSAAPAAPALSQQLRAGGS